MSKEKTKEDLIKETDVYKALEAMISLEVSNLTELLQKRKASKSRTAKSHYDKKIEKTRGKALKYMFQLNRLTNGEVEEVLEEIDQEKEAIAEELK